MCSTLDVSLVRSGFIQVRDETKGQTCAPISFINVSDQSDPRGEEREKEGERTNGAFERSTSTSHDQGCGKTISLTAFRPGSVAFFSAPSTLRAIHQYSAFI